MSPARGCPSGRQLLIISELSKRMPHGQPLPEAPVATSGGVKVADFGWYSKNRLAPIRRESAYSIAPEIRVEVWSDSNTTSDLPEKATLYFATGAEEFRTCNDDGEMLFYLSSNPCAPVAASVLGPDFPAHLDLD